MERSDKYDLKVNYYFRKPGNYSIENVFDTVINSLPAEVKANKLYASKNFDPGFVWRSMRQRADIHHITGAINYIGLGLPSDRTLLTVHDVGHLTNTLKGIRQIAYEFLFWRAPLSKVKYITVVSEFTKGQLIGSLNIHPDRIRVIPNPVNPIFICRERQAKPKPVILQIGKGFNKNLECLIDVATEISCKLLLIRPWEANLEQLLKEKNIEHEFRSDITQGQLVQAYIDCDFVFFASTYEGFGLPIIEAMASGRPVITSNVSPMKEIASGAALLIDPLSRDQLRNAIGALSEFGVLYNELVAKGFRVCRNYLADEVGAQYRQFYEDIIRNA